MKKLFTLYCALLFACVAFAQTDPTGKEVKSSLDTGIISLKETDYNFGKIPQGKPVVHVFTFTNSGSVPLVLETVQASCGCTTPEWSKDPVSAGATSKITVGYNAMNDGPFEKSITITYNGKQTKQINIKGEVWKTPTTSAPENTGLGALKNEH